MTVIPNDIGIPADRRGSCERRRLLRTSINNTLSSAQAIHQTNKISPIVQVIKDRKKPEEEL